MRTILIVDGYNAVFAIRQTRRAMKNGMLAARKELLSICREFVRSSGYIDSFTVVFDGDSRIGRDVAEMPLGGECVFSTTSEADRSIIDAVRGRDPDKRVIVASRDNFVRNNCRALGALVVDPAGLVRNKRSRRVTRPEGDTLSDREKEVITREYAERLGVERER